MKYPLTHLRLGISGSLDHTTSLGTDICEQYNLMRAYRNRISGRLYKKHKVVHDKGLIRLLEIRTDFLRQQRLTATFAVFAVRYDEVYIDRNTGEIMC